jgi:hypothetical protein
MSCNTLQALQYSNLSDRGSLLALRKESMGSVLIVVCSNPLLSMHINICSEEAFVDAYLYFVPQKKMNHLQPIVVTMDQRVKHLENPTFCSRT